MFLKKNRFKNYKLFTPEIIKNKEGVKKEVYTESGSIDGEIYAPSGKIQAEIYGERLNYMINMIVDINSKISEKMAIAYNSDFANYKVISIKNYDYHKVLELEKIK